MDIQTCETSNPPKNRFSATTPNPHPRSSNAKSGRRVTRKSVNTRNAKYSPRTINQAGTRNHPRGTLNSETTQVAPGANPAETFRTKALTSSCSRQSRKKCVTTKSAPSFVENSRASAHVVESLAWNVRHRRSSSRSISPLKSTA